MLISCSELTKSSRYPVGSTIQSPIQELHLQEASAGAILAGVQAATACDGTANEEGTADGVHSVQGTTQQGYSGLE